MLIRVRGRSMIPTFHPGNLLWASRPRVDSLERGQIVLLRLKRSPEGLFLKRLIGLPGERMRFSSRQITINDRVHPEPYVSKESRLQPQADCAWVLGPEDYIVLGDARDDSLDSRRFGPVHFNEIDAIIRFRLWPPARI